MGEMLGMGIAAAALAGVWVIQTLAQMSAMSRRRARAQREMERWLKERHTLVPRVASIASLYMAWNDPLVLTVGAARREALRARSMVERSGREAELSLALGRLMAALDGRPELARHADLAAVLTEMERAENGAAAARLVFNRETEALDDLMRRPLGRVAATLRRLPAPQTFDVDPYLAREAIMAHLAGRGMGAANPFPSPPAAG
jgi:hypothetical protein